MNLWATWCPPCRIEIPALQSLHEDYEGSDDVVVLGLAGDVEGAEIVRPFLEERGITYANGLLTAELRRAFGGVQGFPTTLVIGPDGVVRSRVVGFFAPPAMRAAVRRAAAEVNSELPAEARAEGTAEASGDVTAAVTAEASAAVTADTP